MSKKQLSIVDVWTWFTNTLDSQNLTSSEQLTMLHLIKHINRNFWQPIKISTNALARSINKDARTVKTALSSLFKKNLIYSENDYIQLGIFPSPDKSPSSKNFDVKNFLSMNTIEQDKFLRQLSEKEKNSFLEFLKGVKLFKNIN